MTILVLFNLKSGLNTIMIHKDHSNGPNKFSNNHNVFNLDCEMIITYINNVSTKKPLIIYYVSQPVCRGIFVGVPPNLKIA